jgi:hypothetical protein
MIRVHYNCYPGKILGSSAQHCRTPDIDLLHSLTDRYTGAGNSFLKRIKINNNQADRFNTQFFQLCLVLWKVAGQDPCMYSRVKGFYTPP